MKKYDHAIWVLEYSIYKNKGWIKFYRNNLKRKKIPFCHSAKEVKIKKEMFRKDIIKCMRNIAELKNAIKFLNK